MGNLEIDQAKFLTPNLYNSLMSSWDDHEELIDDQYLMESIEEDQKLAEGDISDDEIESEDEE